MRRLFFDRRDPRLVVPALVVFVVTIVLGFAAVRLAGLRKTPREQADGIAAEGRAGEAEARYRALLLEHPSAELAIALVEHHELATLRAKFGPKKDDDGDAPLWKRRKAVTNEALMSETELDGLVETLPAEISTVARFWRSVLRHDVPESLRAEIVAGADREPPLAWHNRLLAREAMRTGQHEEAARRFEREGLAVAEHAGDVDMALSVWLALTDWDTIHDKLNDPRVAAATGPEIRYQVAVHDRAWRDAARFLALASVPKFDAGHFAMAASAAFGWFFFCLRLGQSGERAKVRVPLYVLAFLLGVVSVAPTCLLIAVEEAKLRLVHTGEPVRDFVFFVFGVGLREEASKLLLFVPLIPLLRRWGTRLDVLVCGAMVGLGFAAEENLNYLANGDLQTALGRFLTANFFHMALTGILASAFDDFLRDTERNAPHFMRASLLVVGLHGAYDLLLSHGGGYLAMAVFVFLSRSFLNEVSAARRRADKGITILHAFVIAVAIVVGVGFVHAANLVGAFEASVVMAEGLLGLAIIIIVFVRTLRDMA